MCGCVCGCVCGAGGAGVKKKPGGYLLSRLIGSIIGARELDFRVRDGNGYCLSAMATGQMNPHKNASSALKVGREKGKEGREGDMRPVSGEDNMVKPHDRLVLLG